MSHAAAHAAIDELRRRWEAEGFVAKGKLHLARTAEHGLHIIAIGGPGSWRTAITVTYAVWVAPFAARETGRPVPWPAKRYKLPEEKAWHDYVGHDTLAGAPRMYVDAIGAVATVRAQTPAAERWFAERDDYARFAASAIASGHATTSAGWRRFQLAALCFLELGQPARAAEMMEVERQYFHRADVIDGHPHDRVLGWWERSATWWREVAGLRAPSYDGAAGPPVPTARVEAPPPPRPRDSIWYASPTSGEWMKTREPDAALARAAALLRFTTFTAWDTAQLKLHNEASPTLVEIEARTKAAWPTPRSFTAAELTEVGVALDPLLADGIARFGPVRFRCWASGYRGAWETWHSYFFWERAAVTTPEDWRAFCVEHQGAQLGDQPRVELELRVDGLALRAKPDGELLPYQGPAFCPPSDAGLSWPTAASLWVDLPRCRMGLRARLPFERDDAAFRAYLGKLSKAIGYALARTHLRALIINQAGTRAYDRKLAKST